jgi:bacillithiol biosynthesis cysteine-adding enzyme BshC
MRGLNARLGAPEAALDAASRLGRDGSLAVVTGQQAGIFTGPCYTLLKATGAVSLARMLEKALSRPVVPVFWAATEDHDLDEACQAWFSDRSGEWARLRYDASRVEPGISVGAVELEAPQVASLCGELERLLGEGYAAGSMLGLVKDTASASATLGEWFCRIVAALLGPCGMVVLDPMDPPLRRLAAPGAALVLGRAEELLAAVARGAERVRAGGFTPQVEVQPGQVPLFYYPSGPRGPRRALFLAADGARIEVRGEDRPREREALLAETAGEPENFSGSVVSRPLLQDTLLPTVAYVAGPGETGYYALYRELFEASGRTLPLVWPRPAVTIVEPAVERLLRQLGLPARVAPEDVARRRSEVLEEADSVGLDRVFGRLRQAVEEPYAAAETELGAVDRTLGQLTRENRGRVLREIGWLEAKARQSLRQRARNELVRLARVEAALWPRGGPQDRLACGLQYLSRFGATLLSELGGLDPGPPFFHQLAYMS